MKSHTGGPSRAHGGTGSGAGRILVIDDEPRICDAIELVLDEHAVTSLTCAEDALAHLAKGEQYDVILCDIRMPGLSGMDFYERLRVMDKARAANVAAKVVFITGDVSRPDVRAFLARVPNGLIQKPFDPAALRAFVARMMSSDRPPARSARGERRESVETGGPTCGRS
jgi:CheY-like chemotaxis protein